MAQMHPRMQTKPHPEICLVDFDCWGHIRSNHIVRQVPWSCMCDRCLLREIANSKVEFFSGQDQSFCWPFAVYRETSWCFLWLYRLYHSTCIYIYIYSIYTLYVFILLYIHMSLSYVFDLSHVDTYTLCAHWCTHFSARRRRHISKTHFCQGGYVNEDAKTHFEDTLNEDEFPPEDELPREDTFRRHIKRRRISPRRRITSRRQISKTH